MADRYWVGGAGTWNTTSTTNWSASSGGASGASVPTAADSVFFDQAGTYTVTLTGALTCLDFTVSAGTVTFSSTGTPTISGSMSLIAGTVWSATGTVTFNATTTGKTITTNGVSIASRFTFDGIGGEWILGSALTVTNAFGIYVNNGTFDTSTNNYTVTAGGFNSSTSTTRTVKFNASTITFTGNSLNVMVLSTVTNLTFNAGTSQINMSGMNAGIGSGGGLTFYNVAFTSTTAGTKAISGANTFNNLAVTAPSTAGVANVTFAANQTINGTLSTTGTAGNRRVFFASDTYGIGWNLTVNSAPSLTDADFRDLYVKGTASPISGTRIGNRGNCSGITFSTPKTVYLNISGTPSWSANIWAATSGGAVSTDNFPLPQDTATITNAATATSIAPDGLIAYVPTVNLSGRTNALTVILNSFNTVYGSWTNGSGVTFSGTSTLTFSGGTTQTITSAGKTFSCPITVDTYGGTVQLADALDIGAGNGLTITNGTFSSQGYSVSIGNFFSSNSNVRTINLGASTLNIQSGIFNFGTVTNLTFNAGTSQINWTAGSGFPTIGGSLTFYNFSFTNNNTTSISISGSNVFNNLTFTAPASAGVSVFSFSANQTINGTLTCSGASAVRRIFLQSDTIGTQRTLTVNAWSASPADVDFRNIALAGSVGTLSGTRFGDCGNNSGITFDAPKTVYWNLAGSQNWSATGWATSSGGSPAVNNFPLAQDTAVFDNTGSAGTVTMNAAWNIGTFDASGRTSAMTFAIGNTSAVVYKNWLFGTGVTPTVGGIGEISFIGATTQTITCNGVQFPCKVIMDAANSTVQLADALYIVSTQELRISRGVTFDAAGYNVTVGRFIQQGTSGFIGTLKMGAGLWTLTGTGNVWLIGSAGNLYFDVGTSTIVLSNTSTAARTFEGGGFYYNKLTIGGTTGTSTLTISGANTFGELASTKTVAHTILFPSGNTTSIGKWSVTGTVGNVVTIGPSTAASAYTISINSPANTGIDYLSVSYCTVQLFSPGEFYVGANSTNGGSNTNAIFFTATPSPRTLYWVGGTGNWSSTTKWSTSSGGASGAAIPMSLDSVIFDSASNATAYTATVDVFARCAAFTMAGPASGNVTWVGTQPIAYHGNVSFAATGITRSYTGTMYWAGNSSYTFTTNGLALASSITVTGIGSTWTLGGAFTNAGSITTNYGTFDTSASGYALTISSFIASTTNIKSSLYLNSSVINISGSSPINFGTGNVKNANFSFSSGTSSITITGANALFYGNANTFYNVTFNISAVSNTLYINAPNSFNNFSITGTTTLAGVRAFSFNANQTISGTLTVSGGDPVRRTFLASDTIGTTRTFTVNAFAAGATDIDFRDITIAGAAAPISGTRFGDCKGNNGITFPAAKTVYYGQTGSANWGTSGSGSWSATSGGALDATMFPLAQDTAVFPAATYPASGSTTTVNSIYNLGTVDMSLRTSNTMTFSTGTQAVYGNWINGTGVTLSGTSTITFAGRGSQTITSAGKTFTAPLVINSPGGSVTLQDAVSFGTASTFSLVAGTFDASTYNVTFTYVASLGVISTGSATRTLAFGSGTWTTPSAGSPAVSIVATGLTVTGTGTISLTSASAKTFAGGGISYSGITLNQGGAGALTVTGNNTFANITKTAVGATTISLGTTTQTVGAFTAAGTAGNLLTITGTTVAAPATLIYTGASPLSGVGYLNTNFIRAYPTTSTWIVGSTSNNGGSLGFSFSTPAIYNVYVVEGNQVSDVTAAAFASTVYDTNIVESNQVSDSIAAAAVFRSAMANTVNAAQTAAAAIAFASSVSNTANATDTTASRATFGAAVSNTANATDSLASKEVFGSAVSNTANATDSIASKEVFRSSIADTVTASQTNGATASFRSAVSNTANATDTTASRATFGAAVSNTANATDTTASRATFGSAVSNTANATDSIAARETLRPAISEQANASQTNSAAQRFGASVSNTANASQTNSATAVFNGAVTATVNVSDSPVAKEVFGSSVSNTVTVTDTIGAAQRFGTSVSEQATASQTNAAREILYPAISEQATASQTNAATQAFNSNATAQATAHDAISTSAMFAGYVTETATGSETDSAKAVFGSAVDNSITVDATNAAQAIFRTNIADTVQALDSTSATAEFAPQVSEAATASDVSAVASSTFNAPVSEAATVSDLASSSAVFGSSVSDAVQITDTPSSTVDFLGSVAESATALDSISAAQRFATAVAESNTISNTISSSAVFNALVYAGGANTITQLTSTLPTGTSFAGATIFNASSASGGLTVAANGTGTGATGGFSAGGNYILFTGANTRSVKTIPLDLTSTTTVSFYMIKGTSANGGEQPDAGENITFSYSINGGSSYTVVSTVILGGTTPVVNPFTLFSINLPVGAKTASTILKWEETTSSGGINDAYGLKDITLTSPGSVTAADSVFSTATFGSAVINTANASETNSANTTIGAAFDGSATVSDSDVGFISFPGTITEAAQASEQDAAQAVFTPQVADGAAASEFVATNFQVNAAATATAQASETTTTAQVANSAVSESAAANGTVAAQAIFRGIIEEVVQGSDRFDTAAVFLAAFSEFARAYADSVGYLTLPSSVSESGRVSDSAAAAGVLGGYISEAVESSETNAAKFFHATFIGESAAGTASVDAAGSVYNAAVTNTLQAVDAVTAGAIFYAAVMAYAGITDVATARYLWELIDDSQTPDWGTINDTQSAGWVEVNDIQAASWQNVSNTQADGWTQIDDTQDPNWGQITP